MTTKPQTTEEKIKALVERARQAAKLPVPPPDAKPPPPSHHETDKDEEGQP